MVSARPTRPTERPLTVVPATFQTPRGWMPLSTRPSARRSRHRGLWRRDSELAMAPPPVENRYRARSSDAGESVETLALALSAWDSKVQAANGPKSPIQT